ncbi:hypothetical protein [Microbacterium jiangjiandongii]|uniref:hypothetical protein n=1 Tax=Microbacterium jiangjiandongii TaxID=3049071 RepID=UPI00214C8498|nr:hypothetical protein [Microbacterium sp. zg.Y843]MCR2814594.1 hypothetical protein [Microbacterium sp. zg.Y843]
MTLSRPRVIPVRKGQVRPTGSWLYVWVEVGSGAVAYVGGTGFDPELRAYLHVASEDPRLGRVRASVPHYDDRDFDVLAFALPEGVDRGHAREALIARLSAAGDDAADLRDVTDHIVQSLEDHRGTVSSETAY